MKFCTSCGSRVLLQIPQGDDRERFVCGSCELVHYTNPRVIVGCLPVYEGRVLLCRRAIEPRRNYWTLPAGFMENGETTLQGAARETWEEARETLKAYFEDEASGHFPVQVATVDLSRALNARRNA